MPKKTFFILLIIFPLVVGLACRFTAKPAEPKEEIDTQPTATEQVEQPAVSAPTRSIGKQDTQDEPEVDAKELRKVKQSPIFEDDSIAYVSFLFENPASDILYEDVEFTAEAFGPRGELIDSSYESVALFYPESTFGFTATFWLSEDDTNIDSVEINWTYRRTSPANPSDNPFSTEKLVVWDNQGSPKVTGKIVNLSSTTFTNININVLCFDKAGDLVGGGNTYLDFIHLNDYMGFITTVDAFGEIARVEAFPNLSYGTDYIDKTDFLSKIKILEDNFTVDKYGWIEGGIVVKNDTNSVLRDSCFYITFYDRNDDIITTGDKCIKFLLPGDTLGLTPWIWSPPDGAEYDHYDILMLPGEADDSYELNSNPFRVNSVSISGDFESNALVNFTNTYTKEVSEVDVFVLAYNADGKIIGGGNSWTSSPTPAGGTDEVEVWITYLTTEKVDHLKAWINPSIWTDFN